MRRRSLVVLMTLGLLAAPATGAANGDEPLSTDAHADAPVDDELAIHLQRLHAEAPLFYPGDYWSISVVEVSDRHLAAANGERRHASLSSAKAVWVVVAIDQFGPAAVEPFVEQIFAESDNGVSSRVLSLWVTDPEPVGNSEGADAINAAMWGLGLDDSYLHKWYGHSGEPWSYGYHRASSGPYWFNMNFMSTNDLARFWAMVAGGDILGRGQRRTFLDWARTPRDEGDSLITPRLPSAAASQVAHKSGWNSSSIKTRRIDAGVVTTPSGDQYAIAVTYRLRPENTAYWNGGARDWARYVSCEIYSHMSGIDRTCTRNGDPYEILNHTTAPIGSLNAVSAIGRNRLQVRGWSLDRDLGPDPVDVRITVDGTTVETIAADQLHAGAHDQYELGNYHGFEADLEVAMMPGRREVCAIGINDSPAGSNRNLGCRTIEIPADYLPTGNLSEVRVKKGLIVAWGWAKDLDTPGPIQVKLTLDGGKLRLLDADRGTGGHGFKMRLPMDLPVGDHEICAIAQNFEGAGPHQNIGCTTVTIPEDWPPEGILNPVSSEQVLGLLYDLTVKGKAWDSDTTDPVEVRIEVNGIDVGGFHADNGANGRKFHDTVQATLAPGTNTVCGIALNHTGGEPTTVLGCYEVEAGA